MVLNFLIIFNFTSVSLYIDVIFIVFLSRPCRPLQAAGASLPRRPAHCGAALQRRRHCQLLVHGGPHQRGRPAAAHPGPHQRLPGCLVHHLHAPPPQTHRLAGWTGAHSLTAWSTSRRRDDIEHLYKVDQLLNINSTIFCITSMSTCITVLPNTDPT